MRIGILRTRVAALHTRDIRRLSGLFILKGKQKTDYRIHDLVRTINGFSDTF